MDTSWLEKTLKILLILYVIELLLNRILIRTLIFMPNNQVTNALAALTSYGGRFALNATMLISILILAVYYRRVLYALPVIILLLLDFTGIVKAYWGLVLVAAVLAWNDFKRGIEALLIAFLVASSISTNQAIVYGAQILWLLAPIPYISRSRVKALSWSLPLSMLILLATLKSPYIMGQILILGMGIVSPWLLPPAIVLYSLSEPSWGRMSLLLTGPRLQLSNQVASIAALYAGDLLTRGHNSDNGGGGG